MSGSMLSLVLLAAWSVGLFLLGGWVLYTWPWLYDPLANRVRAFRAWVMALVGQRM